MSQSARADGSRSRPLPVGRWTQLSALEHAVLAVAAGEGCLRDVRRAASEARDAVRPAWDTGPPEAVGQVEPRDSAAHRLPGDAGLRPGAVRSAVFRLWEQGLIGFYWVADGYPDLDGGDVRRVLGSPRYFAARRGDSLRVGVFLTPAGETLFLGP